jgi:hypothetical protein
VEFNASQRGLELLDRGGYIDYANRTDAKKVLSAAAWTYVLAALGLVLLLDLGTLLMEKPMKLRYGRMRPVVGLYGFLLFSTVLVSGSLALFWGWQEKTLNLFFAGGVLFALSDLILSGTYFGEGKERPRDLVMNYLTYYGGQFLIALSLLWLR